MIWPRSRSLFWTLTGAFFGVLIFAVLLQAITVVLVVEPVTRQWQRTRAQRVAERVAESLAEDLSRGRTDGLERVLARTQSLVEGVRLYYVDENDLAYAVPPLPPGVRARFPALLRGEITPRELGSGRRGPVGSPAAPGGGQGRGRADRFDLAVLARQPVEVDGRARGEVFVVQPRTRLNILGRVPERTLLFLPVALIVAGLAGLGIFHRLQRRLSALEVLAARVGKGDLEARVEDPGADEIGRLGERLNEMTARLRRSRDDLQASDQARRQLLADISHELATPLTTIRGYAETLTDAAVPLEPADRQRYLNDVLHAAERMDRLIRDLLDLARLEAPGLELELETLDLAALVRHSVERLRRRFEEADLGLEFMGDAEQAHLIEADGLRMEQVIDNLLGNELRHVPGGGRVEVDVRPEPGRVWIVVRDDGPGFEASDLPHVFDRFYRADRARTSPGSGLGLAIVREIVRRHGGDVEADNRAGDGAEIRAWLPAPGDGPRVTPRRSGE